MAWVVGLRVMANHEGVYRNARIEQIADFAPSPTTPVLSAGVVDTKQYYVHWLDLDSRNDRWVLAQDLAPAVQSKKQAKSDPVRGTMMRTRQQIRDGIPEREASPEKPEAKGTASVAIARQRQGDSPFFYLPKNIKELYMGKWRVPTWYFSPYQMAKSSYQQGVENAVSICNVSNDSNEIGIHDNTLPSQLSSNEFVDGSSCQTLHLCPFCCQPFMSDPDTVKHVAERCIRHPPGREVYRDYRNGLVMFEVDGLEERLFCQNLALLSKLFLEHKALDFDMSAFVFYVLCVMRPPAPRGNAGGVPDSFGGVDASVHPSTAEGCEVAAYFSKEKRPPNEYNLSCILTLPHHQGRNYGRFMVEMSYEMSKREGRGGTPEKPLSDLGERLYNAFWQDAVLDVVVLHSLHGSGAKLEPLNMTQISKDTGMIKQDIITTMKALNLLDKRNVDVHITQEAARVHEVKRLEKMAMGTKLRFEPHRLCWNPQQYRLVTPLPGVDQCPATAVPQAVSGSSSISCAVQAVPPPMVQYNLNRAMKASKETATSPGANNKRQKRNR